MGTSYLKRVIAALAIGTCGAAFTAPAQAQNCPEGSYCYYVPPAMPDPVGFTNGRDWVFSVASGTANLSYQFNGGTATADTVTAGTPLIVALNAGEAQGSWGSVQKRGGFVASDTPLVIASRVYNGYWNTSATIKEQAFSLGQRFRLGGYNLNNFANNAGGYDVVTVYAPTGAQVTFEAPPDAPSNFWSGESTTGFTVSLSAGQTYTLRTTTHSPIVCDDTHQLDGALVVASAPISVLSGGRGWDGDCGVSGGCGDEGLDHVLPVDRWGSSFAVVNAPGTNANGELIAVVADTDNTYVYLDGSGAESAILDAGEVYHFAPSLDAHLIETSELVAVYHNAAYIGCEMGLSFVAPLEFPSQSSMTIAFDAVHPGNAYVTVPTSYADSVALDGSFAESQVLAVPGRADIVILEFSVTAGAHSITSDGDVQVALLVAGSGTGLYAFLNDFRLPGCGNGTQEGTEGCDDSNVVDGDGCNRICRIEEGSSLTCDETADCESGAFCNLDTGRCVQCLGADDCDDGNDCTLDACSSGTCSNTNESDGTLCVGGVCYDDGGDSTCVACADTAGSGEVDLGCSAAANECLADGSGGVACGPCATDDDCDDGNECTVDTCVAGTTPLCDYTATAAGTSCTGGVCDGEAIAACVECYDDQANLGQDTGCTVEAPVCDVTATVATCVECRTSADCGSDDLCVGAACVAAGISINDPGNSSTLNPTISGTLLGYPAGTGVDVTISLSASEVDTCRAVTKVDQSWSCVVGPLVAKTTYDVLAETTDNVRSHSDTATLVTTECAGAADGSSCTGGLCRGVDEDSRACCTGCWDGISCVAGSADSACGASGAQCSTCVSYASCSTGSCGCDSGYSGDGLVACVGDAGSFCVESDECGTDLVCDTLDSDTCEAINTCGNGALETGETCDDGGVVDSDGCDTNCRHEAGGNCSDNDNCTTDTVCDTLDSGTCEASNTCGNGNLESGETCDDGANVGADGCDAACNNELGGNCSSDDNCTTGTVCDTLDSGSCEMADTCGNGKLESGETCDDGANVGADGCDATCNNELGGDCSSDDNCTTGTVCDALDSGSCEMADTCGNGKLESGETCDDGAHVDADGCDASCNNELGGDCSSDDNCTTGTVCDTLDSGSCEAENTCGNGTVESGEGCDDGNDQNGDGCSATCFGELGAGCLSNADCATGFFCDTLDSNQCEPVDTCGNGVVEDGEGCDDGALATGDGCNELCKKEAGEACTENAQCASGWVCDTLDSNTCEEAATCGNGAIDAEESCDDGNTDDEDGCDSSCKLELGEDCTEDANCANGGVCDTLGSGTCETENTCGNGVIEDGEACDDGARDSDDGCDASCKLELGETCSESEECASGTVCDSVDSSTCEAEDTCGNSVIESGEACDDGNSDSDDGCDSTCKQEEGEGCTKDEDCGGSLLCTSGLCSTPESTGGVGGGSTTGDSNDSTTGDSGDSTTGDSGDSTTGDSGDSTTGAGGVNGDSGTSGDDEPADRFGGGSVSDKEGCACSTEGTGVPGGSRPWSVSLLLLFGGGLLIRRRSGRAA